MLVRRIHYVTGQLTPSFRAIFKLSHARNSVFFSREVMNVRLLIAKENRSTGPQHEAAPARPSEFASYLSSRVSCLRH
jgi:hypothetical protein